MGENESKPKKWDFLWTMGKMSAIVILIIIVAQPILGLFGIKIKEIQIPFVTLEVDQAGWSRNTQDSTVSMTGRNLSDFENTCLSEGLSDYKFWDLLISGEGFFYEVNSGNNLKYWIIYHKDSNSLILSNPRGDFWELSLEEFTDVMERIPYTPFQVCVEDGVGVFAIFG